MRHEGFYLTALFSAHVRYQCSWIGIDSQRQLDVHRDQQKNPNIAKIAKQRTKKPAGALHNFIVLLGAVVLKALEQSGCVPTATTHFLHIFIELVDQSCDW